MKVFGISFGVFCRNLQNYSAPRRGPRDLLRSAPQAASRLNHFLNI